MKFLSLQNVPVHTAFASLHQYFDYKLPHSSGNSLPHILESYRNLLCLAHNFRTRHIGCNHYFFGPTKVIHKYCQDILRLILVKRLEAE